jgi:hypothetical protein
VKIKQQQGVYPNNTTNDTPACSCDSSDLFAAHAHQLAGQNKRSAQQHHGL